MNPTFIEFTASSDHNVTIAGVGPAVTSYEARFFAPGASAPVSTSNLGKPTPDATGKIAIDISTTIVAIPVDPAIQYSAKVAAIGPAGEGVSAASNPFLRVAPPQAVVGVTLVRR